MRVRFTVIATLAATAASVVVAAPADAALYSHDRFDFTFAETFDECGMTIEHTAAGHGGFTIRTIKGTDDQALFKTAREGMLEYRFDNVPAGTYAVELDFADVKSTQIGKRVFDVLVEGQLAIPALDLALEAGTYTAVSRQYTVKVTDGQLNVRFATRQGKTIVNAIRISERPDKAS